MSVNVWGWHAFSFWDVVYVFSEHCFKLRMVSRRFALAFQLYLCNFIVLRELVMHSINRAPWFLHKLSFNCKVSFLFKVISFTLKLYLNQVNKHVTTVVWYFRKLKDIGFQFIKQYNKKKLFIPHDLNKLWHRYFMRIIYIMPLPFLFQSCVH